MIDSIKMETTIIKHPTHTIEAIAQRIHEKADILKNASAAPMGTYSSQHLLTLIRTCLDDLEESAPAIRQWVNSYLDQHRATLWLHDGFMASHRDILTSELAKTWPNLYAPTNREYKGFILDRNDAQREKRRQRERQDTPNPAYVPFHPDGCPSGCCCWMLDSMEQWYEEEQKEQEASKNIFFNSSLLWKCHDAMLEDLPSLRHLWSTWEPSKRKPSSYTNKPIESSIGKTKLQVTLSWFQTNFRYCRVLDMFSRLRWSGSKEIDTCFSDVWENMDEIEPFVQWRRSCLQQIEQYLQTME
jgi:hypothetical protein